MTQHSEDRLEEPTPARPESARILPFERPQSELQRAVQQRAQEALDLDRERSAQKPAPLKWAIIALIAAIPVVLTFGAVDRFLSVFYKINDSYKSAPAAPAPATQSAPPAQTDPDVVILQSYEAVQPAPQPEAQKQ